MSAPQNTLAIREYKDPAEAPRYSLPGVKGCTIEVVNIVRKGTEGGRATVDFVLIDEEGQRYVVMLTGRLVRNLSGIIGIGEPE